MIFHLQPVHVHLDAGFADIAAEKFSRLERFFSDDPEVYLIVKKEKFEFILEAKIQCRKTKTFMKTRSNNLNAGLDELVDKLKNSLSKDHDRRRHKKGKDSIKNELYAFTSESETKE
ncbi:MAG: HPF/RaiA family ribosome-associated protein [Candidatus Omnitrophica bacterium]|nr:HPF/RaiA family ribosome-associated protein [Candidatus Omnitrophota bacterium]